MTGYAVAGPTLEFLVEPGFVLGRHGQILGANTPARRLLAADLAGRNIFDWVAGEPADFDDFLRRASRSSSPLVGTLTLNANGGTEAFRVHGARLPPGEEAETRLVVQCRPVRDDQFALLTRRVQDLDAQLRQRMQEKAALEESLRQNQTLLRELQHRVKNNIQLMMSLIRMSAKGHDGWQAAEIVKTARLRLRALASTQEAIYRSATTATVSSRFLESLVTGIGSSAGFSDALEIAIEDTDLESEEAHCLALIINELVTNAGKHGLRNGKGTIRVSFEKVGEACRLVVQDDGPGMAAEAGERTSGLKLVRGLCRQIGGKFETRNEGGTRCSVDFGDRITEERAR